MIYLDSSVALASVFTEARMPPAEFWTQELTSSRLFEYEVLSRAYARGLEASDLALARRLIAGVTLIDMSSVVLARALAPFPLSVRTLDGLHLATMDYLRARGQTLRLASYDKRLIAAANAIGFALEAGL